MIKKFLILAGIAVRIFPGLKKLTSLLSVTLFAKRLMDAVLFFQSASVPYDGSGEVILFAMRPAKTDEIYPPAPELTAEDISFYDALKIVVESANAKFWIRGDGVVVVEPKSWICDDGCKPGYAWLLDEGSWPKTGDGESMGVSQNLKEGN